MNIYGGNINNITAIVGKNSTGKSNFLACIGDLISSFDESSFIIIYYDEEKNKYYFECNQINIKDENDNIISALHQKYKPKTLILEKNENGEYKIINKLNNIEFITIKENLNKEMYPSANSSYSTIGRFGLSYEKTGLLYQFEYLLESKSEKNENYKKNDNINVSFKIHREWNEYDDYLIKILPEQVLNEVYYFDNGFDNERSIYKKMYMLRFFEITINKIRNIKNETVKSIINDLLDKLRNKIENCNENFDELINHYDEIKGLIIDIRTRLMNNHYSNIINMELCYKKFIDLLEKIVYETDSSCFMNSFEFIINIMELKEKIQLRENIKKLFEMIDKEEDIRLEFLNSNKLEICYRNLSDGLKERFNLFSTLYTCIKRNNIEGCKNIALLLDEPDVHMHPEWARNLLKDIKEYLYEKFNFINFHIIFSTHSPFMLSDITNDNVIYLEKNEEGKAKIKINNINTFGANIHTLLKQSFFMNFTIGQMSKEIINDVIKFLNDEDNKYRGNMTQEKARYICNNVGEQLIKAKLMELYKIKYKESTNDINKKILYYQDEIKELNNEVANNIIDRNKLESIKKSLRNTYETIDNILNKDGESIDKN